MIVKSDTTYIKRDIHCRFIIFDQDALRLKHKPKT